MNSISWQRFMVSIMALVGLVFGTVLLSKSFDMSDYQGSIVTDPLVLSYVFTGDWEAFNPNTGNYRFDVTFFPGDETGGKGIWKEREMDYSIEAGGVFVYRYNAGGNRPNNYTFKIEFDNSTNEILSYRRSDPTTLFRELRKTTEVVYPQSADELAAVQSNAFPGSVPKCWMNGVCTNGFGIGEREGRGFIDYEKALQIRDTSGVPYFQRYWKWAPDEYSSVGN